VAVAARAESDRILFTIDDDGAGLPKEQRAAVFDRGKRLDESVPGSGLGLAIARDLMLAHGGDIRLARSTGDGTVFELELPASTKTPA
jgi:signal transduction histidine kinase